jgi:hypothetical protein
MPLVVESRQEEPVALQVHEEHSPAADSHQEEPLAF